MVIPHLRMEKTITTKQNIWAWSKTLDQKKLKKIIRPGAPCPSGAHVVSKSLPVLSLFDVQVIQLPKHHRHKGHRDHLCRIFGSSWEVHGPLFLNSRFGFAYVENDQNIRSIRPPGRLGSQNPTIFHPKSYGFHVVFAWLSIIFLMKMTKKGETFLAPKKQSWTQKKPALVRPTGLLGLIGQ